MVDKPTNDGKITVKINGQSRSLEEVKDVSIDVNHSSKKEMEAESFDWVLADSHQGSTRHKSLKKRFNSRRFLHPTTIAVMIAVIIGTGFGIFVVKTITAEKPLTSLMPSMEDEPTTAAPAKEESAKEKLTLTSYVVQGGVFSSEAAAKEMADSLHRLDLPASIMEKEKQFFVFLGVADSLDASKDLSSLYKDEGVDVFAKEVDWQVEVVGNKESFNQLLDLYEQLAQTSISQLAGQTVDVNSIVSEINKVEDDKQDTLKVPLEKAVEAINSNQPMEAQHQLLGFLQVLLK